MNHRETPRIDAVTIPEITLDKLRETLSQARARGFLGKGSVLGHIEHAIGFGAVVLSSTPILKEFHSTNPGEPLKILDLGSGAGLPGLVLAVMLPHARVTLLDSSSRRCAFLSETVDDYGVSSRVEVKRTRAEVAGRIPLMRRNFDVVVARSFGSPAVVSECGSPFLRVNGVMVVSEPPPGSEDSSTPRWPEDGLRALNMVSQGTVETGFTYRVIRQDHLCPERFPRRTGVPSKRPLW